MLSLRHFRTFLWDGILAPIQGLLKQFGIVGNTIGTKLLAGKKFEEIWNYNKCLQSGKFQCIHKPLRIPQWSVFILKGLKVGFFFFYILVSFTLQINLIGKFLVFMNVLGLRTTIYLVVTSLLQNVKCVTWQDLKEHNKMSFFSFWYVVKLNIHVLLKPGNFTF